MASPRSELLSKTFWVLIWRSPKSHGLLLELLKLRRQAPHSTCQCLLSVLQLFQMTSLEAGKTLKTMQKNTKGAVFAIFERFKKGNLQIWKSLSLQNYPYRFMADSLMRNAAAFTLNANARRIMPSPRANAKSPLLVSRAIAVVITRVT